MTFFGQFTLLVIVAVLPTLALGGRKQDEEEKLVRDDPTKAVRMLNRFSFNDHINTTVVDDYIVHFCVDWLPICQGLWGHYRNAAQYWEKELVNSASSWQTTAVRFAEVSCETDKPLCNLNNVEYYPTVLHFKGGKLVSEWVIYESMMSEGVTSASKHLLKWIKQELGGKLNTTTIEAEAAKKDTTGGLGVASHVGEFFGNISWSGLKQAPLRALFGYFMLALALGSFAWTVFTGLEIEVKTALSALSGGKDGKGRSWQTVLLPEFKEMAASRSIVRTSIEL